jgi:hypothetical protein
MQPLRLALRLAGRSRRALRSGAAGLALAWLAGGPALAGPCPWIVQPSEALAAGEALPSYDIVFTGPMGTSAFYGFTVDDHELAWQLSEAGRMPDLSVHGQALEAVELEDRVAYRPALKSVVPRTLYLVAASGVVSELERIDARIEPDRPVTVGFRTRGATDMSGSLPHRSMPGIEIRSASADNEAPGRNDRITAAADDGIQLCAYLVAWR